MPLYYGTVCSEVLIHHRHGRTHAPMLSCPHKTLGNLRTPGTSGWQCLLSVPRVMWQECHLFTLRVSGTVINVYIFWLMSVTVDPNISNTKSCSERFFLCSHTDVTLGNNRTMHAEKPNTYNLSSMSKLALPSHKNMTALQYVLTFRRRIKSHLSFAGIIRRLPYSTRFQDKG